MAHNLSTYTDEAGEVRHCSFSLRKNPWHGLGTVVDMPLGSAEVIGKSGLDWGIDLLSMYTADMDPVPLHRAVKRSDTGAILGVVGKDYEPLQNREMFQFMDALTGTVETAGALGGGETVWVMVTLPGLDIILGEDVTRSYLLVTNSHIGERRLSVLPTTVRVVCNNTLTMALAGPRRRNTLASGFTIRHTSGMRVALADVGKAYAQALDAQRDTTDAFAFLASKPLKETMVKSFFNTVFAGPDESDRAKTIRQNREDALRRILASPTCNVLGTAGSALMLLHAAVEYVDHERTTRVHTGKSELESRLASAAFGSGADLKRKAWNTVLELAV